MKYISDNTGRFSQRPYFEATELDNECETILSRFMLERCGKVTYPVPTDVLTKLIEHDAADLDLYADLSAEGPEVEGLTAFYVGQRPRVRIASRLSEHKWHEHRLRTTLSHEYGHVKFHDCFWQLEAQAPSLFSQPQLPSVQKCRRTTILDAPKADWMEWQAGYICGALLMPRTVVLELVYGYSQRNGLDGSIETAVVHALELQKTIAVAFDVSEEAAGVRLTKLELLSAGGCGPCLF